MITSLSRQTEMSVPVRTTVQPRLQKSDSEYMLRVNCMLSKKCAGIGASLESPEATEGKQL